MLRAEPMDLFRFLRRRRRSADRTTDQRQPAQVPVMLALPAPNPIDLPPPPPTPQPLSPEEVRRLLFDAVAAGDEVRLHALCHEHQELILSSMTEWLDVPEPIRANPQIFDWYANGLRSISQFCAQAIAASGITQSDLTARIDAAVSSPSKATSTET